LNQGRERQRALQLDQEHLANICFHDQMLVVLHGFIKKTQKTPADDLALAKRRMKEVTK
jgi:phage-related protein